MAKQSTPGLPKRVKNLLRGIRDPFMVISEARQNLSFRQMPALIRALVYRNIQSGQAFPYLFPKSIEELRKDDRTLAEVPLDVEIWWGASFLSIYSSRLNNYLGRKRQIETRIWQSDYVLRLSD